MTSAPFSIADLNAIAGQASFQSVIDVARRFGLSAVGGGSSSALTDLLDGVYSIIGPGFDPERRYVTLVAYPDLGDPCPAYTYRDPSHPTEIQVVDVCRIRENDPDDEPFGRWRIARAPAFEATAIAYPLSAVNGEYMFNRHLSPDVELTLINPKDGLLPPALAPGEQWMIAIGCSLYDWTYAQKNIADLRHSDVIAAEREFFNGRRIGWRMIFDEPVNAAPGRDDRPAKLIRGDIVGDRPPTPDEVMRVVAATGRMPRIALAVFPEAVQRWDDTPR